jgi:hypothetical protein
LLKVFVQLILEEGIVEIGLSVQWFYSVTVAAKVSWLKVQAIKAKSSQPNNSLNLPARRARARSVEAAYSIKA